MPRAAILSRTRLSGWRQLLLAVFIANPTKRRKISFYFNVLRTKFKLSSSFAVVLLTWYRRILYRALRDVELYLRFKSGEITYKICPQFRYRFPTSAYYKALDFFINLRIFNHMKTGNYK